MCVECNSAKNNLLFVDDMWFVLVTLFIFLHIISQLQGEQYTNDSNHIADVSLLFVDFTCEENKS